MLTCKEASERHCLALPVSTMMESGSACKEEVSLGFRRLAIGRVINRTTTTGKEELHVTNMVLQLSPTQGMDSCSQAHCTSADLLPRLHTSTMSLPRVRTGNINMENVFRQKPVALSIHNMPGSVLEA